jgi:hypothetical protein
MSDATVDSNRDEWMMSPRPSLLGVTVATDVFYPSLLNYHCSDGSVAHDHSDL